MTAGAVSCRVVLPCLFERAPIMRKSTLYHPLVYKLDPESCLHLLPILTMMLLLRQVTVGNQEGKNSYQLGMHHTMLQETSMVWCMPS